MGKIAIRQPHVEFRKEVAERIGLGFELPANQQSQILF
jgi:hypothetical protein